jgi:hypothetical protein
MPPTNCDPCSPAIRRTARRFVADLAAEAVLTVVARTEAVLSADDEASPFEVDEALARAWPAVGICPRQEVIWATAGNDPGGVRLRAFDATGRVLLSRTYRAAVERKGERRV